MRPSVVSAVKSGAVSLICSVITFLLENLLGGRSSAAVWARGSRRKAEKPRPADRMWRSGGRNLGSNRGGCQRNFRQTDEGLRQKMPPQHAPRARFGAAIGAGLSEADAQPALFLPGRPARARGLRPHEEVEAVRNAFRAGKLEACPRF